MGIRHDSKEAFASKQDVSGAICPDSPFPGHNNLPFDGNLHKLNDELYLSARKSTHSLHEHITPVWPSLQAASCRWSERICRQKRQRATLFTLLLLAWLTTCLICRHAIISPILVDKIYQPVHQLSFTDSLWLPNHACGLDASNCPVQEGPVAFHCPPGSRNPPSPATEGSAPIFAGPHRIHPGQPLVIGGPIYRGDSHICAAAVHSGTLTDERGGCAVLDRLPMTNSYPGSGMMYGVDALAVPTYFPQSFRFRYGSGTDQCRVRDARWVVPWAGVVFTGLVWLGCRGPLVPFSTAVGVGLAHAIWAEDAAREVGQAQLVRTAEPGREGILSLGFLLTRAIPLVLCAVLLYTRSIKYALKGVDAHLEKTVCWLGGLWLSSPSLFITMTFLAGIAHTQVAPATLLDDRQNAVKLSMIGVIALHHIHLIRYVGGISQALPLYVVFLVTALATASFPALPLPAHFLALVLLVLPGGKLQTRLSLLSQGILVGFLLQGIAREGLSLHKAMPPAITMGNTQPPRESLHFPNIMEPEIYRGWGGSNITFTWATPVPDGVDGISMLVNDVERDRIYFRGDPKSEGLHKPRNYLLLERTPQAVPDYIRFSWLRGVEILGWGAYGVWEDDCTWSGALAENKESAVDMELRLL